MDKIYVRFFPSKLKYLSTVRKKATLYKSSIIKTFTNYDILGIDLSFVTAFFNFTSAKGLLCLSPCSSPPRTGGGGGKGIATGSASGLRFSLLFDELTEASLALGGGGIVLDEFVATYTPGFCVLLLMKPGEDEDSCNSSFLKLPFAIGIPAGKSS